MSEQFETTTTVEKQQDALETISQQQLLTLARDKIKEAKGLAAKNSRLESKYIEVYKKFKAMQKDQVAFVGFMKMVFGNIQEKAPGTWQIGQISENWKKREEQMNKKLQVLDKEASKQKSMIEENYKNQLKEEALKLDEKMNAATQNLSKQIQQLKEKNQRLANEFNISQEKILTDLKNVEKKLSKKQEELKEMTEQKVRFQTQLNRIRVNDAKEELQNTMNTFNNKRQDIQARTQQLLIRQELDRIQEKNDELNDVISKLQTKIRAKNKQIEILKQKNEASIRQLRPSGVTMQPSTQIINIPLQPNSPKKQKEKEVQPIQKEYLKNIFVRFMKSLNESNYVQAQILENVLMTLLQFNTRERELAAIRQRQWWNFFQ